MFFIFSAFAQEASTAPSAAGGFDFRGLIPFVLVFAIMYLLILRPQQKKMKQHQALISSVRRGDRVLMAGGIIGVVHKVINNEELLLELEEGVKVRVVKTAISQILAKTEPLKAEGSTLEDKDKKDFTPAQPEENTSTVVSLEKKPQKRKNTPKV